MYHEQLPYRRVSPKLIVLRQIYNALGFGIPLIAVMIGLSILHATTEFFTRFALAPLLYAVPAALLVTGIVFVFIIPRQVKALGYLKIVTIYRCAAASYSATRWRCHTGASSTWIFARARYNALKDHPDCHHHRRGRHRGNL